MWKWASTNGGVTRSPAASISRAPCSARRGADGGDAAMLDRDVDLAAAVGQAGIANDEIHFRSCCALGTPRL